MATWYPALGFFLVFVGIIISIILFFTKKKWYPVLYTISILIYIFTVGFVIDVFDFTKNGILLILAVSAALMILVGSYIGRK